MADPFSLNFRLRLRVVPSVSIAETLGEEEEPAQESLEELWPLGARDEHGESRMDAQAYAERVFGGPSRARAPRQAPPLHLTHRDRPLAGEPGCVESAACPVCLETVPDVEFAPASACGHRCCVTCATTHLQVFVTESRWPPLCAVCRDPLTLDYSLDVMRRSGADTVRLEQLCIMREHMNVVYCSNASCASPLDHVPGSQTGAEMVVCPLCNQKTCSLCNAQWHPDSASCEVAGRDGEDACLVNLAAENRWKRCPGCRTYAEKELGCNHCVCICGTHFCFRCGTPYLSTQRDTPTSNMYGQPGCDCNLFEDM